MKQKDFFSLRNLQKRMIRRGLAFLLSVCLLGGSIPEAGVAANAQEFGEEADEAEVSGALEAKEGEDPSDETIERELTLGEASNLRAIPEAEYWFRFTPEETGLYQFTYGLEEGDEDKGIYRNIGLYNSREDKDYFACGGRPGMNHNFALLASVEKGETIYAKLTAGNDREPYELISASILVEKFAAQELVAGGEGCTLPGAVDSAWLYFCAPAEGSYVFKGADADDPTSAGSLRYYNRVRGERSCAASGSDILRALKQDEIVWIEVPGSYDGNFRTKVTVESDDYDVLTSANSSDNPMMIERKSGDHVLKFTAQDAGVYKFSTTGDYFKLYTDIHMKEKSGIYFYDNPVEIVEDEYYQEGLYGTTKKTPEAVWFRMEAGQTVYLTVTAPISYTSSYSYTSRVMVDACAVPALALDEVTPVESADSANLWYTFTAAEAGFYHYTFTAGTYNNGEPEYTAYQNDAEVYQDINAENTRLYSDSTNFNYKKEPAEFVMELAAGETVYIRTRTRGQYSNEAGSGFMKITRQAASVTTASGEDGEWLLSSDSLEMSLGLNPEYTSVRGKAKVRLSNSWAMSRYGYAEYKVTFRYREKNGGEWIASDEILQLGCGDRTSQKDEFIWKNLKPGTEYEWQARVCDQIVSPNSERAVEQFDGSFSTPSTESDKAVMSLKDGGSIVCADISILDQKLEYVNIRYREKGTEEWICTASTTGLGEGRNTFQTKPDTTYEVQLVGEKILSYGENPVYDRKEITTGGFPADVTAEAGEITDHSAEIIVHVSDYAGIWLNRKEDSYYGISYTTAIEAQTEYFDEYYGQNQKVSKSIFMESTRESRGGDIRLSLENLKSGTEYKLPVRITEGTDDSADSGIVRMVTFTTADSPLKDRLHLDTSIGETDSYGSLEVTYTISVDDPKEDESYSYTLYCGSWGVQRSHGMKTGYLKADNNFTKVGKLHLAKDAVYEIKVCVDGYSVTTTADTTAYKNPLEEPFQEPEEDVDQERYLLKMTPFSFGGVVDVDVRNLPQVKSGGVASYAVSVTTEDGGVIPLYSMAPMSFGSGGSLDARNGWNDICIMQNVGEQNYTWPGDVFPIYIDIYASGWDSESSEEVCYYACSKKFMMATPNMKVEMKAKDITSTAAVIHSGWRYPDAYFSVFQRTGALKLLYREAGTDSAWKAEYVGMALDHDAYKTIEIASDTTRLEGLKPGTEYEVKLTPLENEEKVYTTLNFTTKEASDARSFGKISLRFPSSLSVEVGEGFYCQSDNAMGAKVYLDQLDQDGQCIASTEMETNIHLTTNWTFWNFGMPLCQETAFLRFRAVETTRLQDAGGQQIVKEATSKLYRRDYKPDGAFDIQATSVDSLSVRSLDVGINYTGDMHLAADYTGADTLDYIDYPPQYFDVTLSYGRGTDESKWKTADSIASFRNDAFYPYGRKPYRIHFEDLDVVAGLTYQAKLTVRVQGQPEELNGNGTPYEWTLDLGSFVPQSNTVIDMETAFPDKTFREMVFRAADVYDYDEVTTLTKKQLENVTWIEQNRWDFDAPAIQTIQGVELLSNLSVLKLRNHEIADVASIDWSKLPNLSELDLKGNNLTEIPDLSANGSKLGYNVDGMKINLDENLIPAQQFAGMAAKMPGTVQSLLASPENQRTGGLKIVTEDTYYQSGRYSPLVIRQSGYKSGLPYEVVYQIDGKETIYMNRVGWNEEDTLFAAQDLELSEGKHTLSVTITGGGDTQTVQNTFTVAQNSAYAERESYRFCLVEEAFEMTLFAPQEVSTFYIWDSATDSPIMQGTLAKTDRHPDKADFTEKEYRYHKLSGNGEGVEVRPRYMFRLEATDFVFTKYQKPKAGTYDVKLYYRGTGETETLKNLVTITDTAVITGGIMGYDDIADGQDEGFGYDSMGDSFYLYLMGYSFDPSKLEYRFIDAKSGKPLTAEYVSSKPVYDGYILKMKKTGEWGISMMESGDSVRVTVTPKEGYSVVFKNSSFNVTVKEGIYYFGYNLLTGMVEVGVTSNLSARSEAEFTLTEYFHVWAIVNDILGKEITLVRQEQQEDNGLLIFKPMYKDEICELKVNDYYVLELKCGSCTDKWMGTVGGMTYDTDHWTGPGVIKKGRKETEFVYYSGIGYEDYKGFAEHFSVKLTGENLSEPLEPKEFELGRYGEGDFTKLTAAFDTSKLAAGTYLVEAQVMSVTYKYQIAVVDENKFVITNSNLNATWKNKDTFGLTLYTMNTGEDDEFTVSVTDVFGKKVTGVTTKVVKREPDLGFVNLEVTGLKKENAYRQYYLFIKHKKLGIPYFVYENEKKETELYPFYGEDLARGDWTLISPDAGFGALINRERLTGVTVYDKAKLPVRVRIYRPYETEVLAEAVIEDRNSLGNGENFYFTKSMTDALPDKDGIYDLTAIDADGYMGYWGGYHIGREILYTIRFDGNGATSGKMGDQTMRVGNNGTLSKNVYEKPGYVFSGWNTEADGSGVSYADEATVRNLTEAENATVTLYARWTKEDTIWTAADMTKVFLVGADGEPLAADPAEEAYIVTRTDSDRTPVLRLRNEVPGIVDAAGKEKDCTITYQSSDPKVIGIGKVSAMDKSVTDLNVGKAGYALLTATANDVPKSSVSFLVKVVERTSDSVVLEEKAVTINAAKTDRSAYVTVYNGFGARLTGVSVLPSGKNAADITADVADEETGLVRVKLGPGMTGGNVILRVNVEGLEQPKDLALKVNVTSKKPTLTARQLAKVDTFRKSAAGSLHVIVPGETITKVAVEDKDPKKPFGYELVSSPEDLGGSAFVGHLKVKEGGNPSNKSFNLKVWVDGYGEPLSKTMSVSVEKSKCKLASASGTVYVNDAGEPIPGLNTVQTTLIDSKTKAPMDLTTAEISHDKGDAYSVTTGPNGEITVVANKAIQKKDTMELTITDADWSEPVRTKFSVAPAKPGAASLVLARKTVTLYNYPGSPTGQSTAVRLVLKGGNIPDVLLESLVITESAKNKTKADEALQVFYDPENRCVVARKNSTALAAGSYAYDLTLGEGLFAGKPLKATLTVKVADVRETARSKMAKLSAKGKIDVLNRQGTSLTLTTKFASIPYDAEILSDRTVLEGEAAELFEIVGISGSAVTLKLKEDAEVNTKQDYLVRLRYVIRCGGEEIQLATNLVKVKPEQKKGKVSVAGKTSFYVARKESAPYRFAMTNSAGEAVALKDVRLVTDNRDFTYRFDEVTGGGVLDYVPAGGTERGKTYTLKFQLYPAQAGGNEAPVNVSCKVKILN